MAGVAAEQNVVVDVLCNEVSPNLERMAGVRNRYAVPFSKKMGSWYRKCLRWFGTTPTSDRWSRVAAEVVAEDYDVVVAICAGTQLTPVVCGRHLAQKLGCKFAIYAVDAIPAPGGWVRKRNEYWGKMRIVRRNWSAADYVAAANRHMLEFQLSTFRHRAGLQTSVLYTSSPEEWHNNPVSNRTLFLYIHRKSLWPAQSGLSAEGLRASVVRATGCGVDVGGYGLQTAQHKLHSHPCRA